MAVRRVNRGITSKVPTIASPTIEEVRIAEVVMGASTRREVVVVMAVIEATFRDIFWMDITAKYDPFGSSNFYIYFVLYF